VAIEAQAQACTIAFDDADGIRPINFNILPDSLDAGGFEPIQDEFGDGLFPACRAWDAGEIATQLGELIAVNLGQDFFCCIAIKGHLLPPQLIVLRNQAPILSQMTSQLENRSAAI
jgi:hypothetical protein